MAITKKSMDMVVEQIKDFFKNLLNPNMKIEDIADVVSSRLDPIIIEHEKKGLRYSAGKFYIKSADEKHFRLEFEMFFKDDDDKWHKLANESELRDITLLEDGAAKTLQRLKSIEFPISAPEITEQQTAIAENKILEETYEDLTGVKVETKSDDKTAVNLEK